MVPLNEVKGQMEDKSVSHLNMPTAHPTRQKQTDSEREIGTSAQSWMHFSLPSTGNCSVRNETVTFSRFVLFC